MKKESVDGKIIIKISIFWLFIFAIICTVIIAFFRNYIFATYNIEEDDNIEDSQIIVESNENSIDILQLMVENNYSNKKLINEEREIKFEIENIKDNQIAEGQEVITKKGKVGIKKVTALQQYENNTYISEEILESDVISQPVKQVVHIGTSKFLAKYNVSIGDTMYLTETSDLKKESDENSETLSTINRYLDLELMEVSEEWTKVKYKDFEGYLQNSKLTSESVVPKIKEKNRIAKLQDSLSEDMDISKVSGLTLSDYKTVLSYNSSDKNHIFSDNVETFFKAEQEYQINGIFLAAIAIHESAWGTSYLATEKNNLFGYRAFDRDPINSAQDFVSYEDCINTVAKALSEKYLSTTGSYYYGSTIQAVNTKYASDKSWYQKVYSYMEYLYEKLG